MTAAGVKQKSIVAIAVPVVAGFVFAGVATASREFKDNPPAWLHDAFAFVSTLNIGGGCSPAAAGAVAVVLFLAGVVSGLSGFAFSSVAACVLWLLPAVAVGAAGGVISGFSAFPGSILVVYLALRGASKAETRGITQPYILTLQLISLSILGLTHSAIFNMQFGCFGR